MNSLFGNMPPSYSARHHHFCHRHRAGGESGDWAALLLRPVHGHTNAGEASCSAEYTTAGPESLHAVPEPGYMRTLWSCGDGLGHCNLTITSDLANDSSAIGTYNATFEPVKPVSKAAVYTYNAAGQRVAKTVAGVTTLYVYNSAGQLMAETNSSGVTLVEYIYLDGEPIAQVLDTNTTSEEIYYVHNDHLGTPQRISDSDRVTVWGAETTPFGEAYAENSMIDNKIRFPGQHYDGETGFHYNYFRDYDPSLGRYLQSDPIGLQGGLNTYTYVVGNPLIYVDPLGLEAWVNAFPNSQGGYNFTAYDNQGSAPITGNFNNNTTNFNQIRPGTYNVIPRPTLPNTFSNRLNNRNANAGNPTISNTDDWNTIQYSNGDITRGAQFHEGQNGTSSGVSQACMVSDRETNNALNQMFQSNYNNGGVTLTVYPPGFQGI